jgi:F0F1-type ATP synthase membrane subunit a
MAMRVIPMNWYECGPEMINKIFDSSGRLYICLSNSGAYAWEDITQLKNVLVLLLLIVAVAVAFRKLRKKNSKKKTKRRRH